MSEFMVMNPGRRKRRRRSRRRATARRRSNPGNPRRRRRSMRRNPGLFGGRMNLGGISLQDVGMGVAGAVGTELGGAAIVRMLPANLQGNVAARLATKGVLVLAGVMLAKRFVGASAAKALGLGGGISIGVELVREYMLPHLPGVSELVHGYVESGDTVSGYVTGDSLGALPPSNTMFTPVWGG